MIRGSGAGEPCREWRRAAEGWRDGRYAAGGFTLIEVVVALVIFSVGLLGVAGMVTSATGTLGDVRAITWSVTITAEVADSLGYWGAAGSGERNLPDGVVRWEVEPEGNLARVVIEALPRRFREGSGDPLAVRRLRMEALVPLEQGGSD